MIEHDQGWESKETIMKTDQAIIAQALLGYNKMKKKKFKDRQNYRNNK